MTERVPNQERGEPAAGPPPQGVDVEFERVLDFLQRAEMKIDGRIPWSSNYTFVVLLDDGSLQGLAIYKPLAGEQPLWDFPAGTLAMREYAAFLISEALGWRLVPPTVLRDGTEGHGMVQLYIEADPEEHYFALRGRHNARFQQVALFDHVVNNADRKAGHVLCDSREQIWLIDHGLTFHAEDKVRTVIWDFAGSAVPALLLDDLAVLDEDLARSCPLTEALDQLLRPAEVRALRNRVRALRAGGQFPQPGPGRRIPWPPI